MTIPRIIDRTASKECRTEWWTAHPVDSVSALLDLASAFSSSLQRSSDAQPDDDDEDMISSSDSQLGDDDDDLRPTLLERNIGTGKPSSRLTIYNDSYPDPFEVAARFSSPPASVTHIVSPSKIRDDNPTSAFSDVHQKSDRELQTCDVRSPRDQYHGPEQQTRADIVRDPTTTNSLQDITLHTSEPSLFPGDYDPPMDTLAILTGMPFQSARAPQAMPTLQSDVRVPQYTVGEMNQSSGLASMLNGTQQIGHLGKAHVNHASDLFW